MVACDHLSKYSLSAHMNEKIEIDALRSQLRMRLRPHSSLTSQVLAKSLNKQLIT